MFWQRPRADERGYQLGPPRISCRGRNHGGEVLQKETLEVGKEEASFHDLRGDGEPLLDG